MCVCVCGCWCVDSIRRDETLGGADRVCRGDEGVASTDGWGRSSCVKQERMVLSRLGSCLLRNNRHITRVNSEGSAFSVHNDLDAGGDGVTERPRGARCYIRKKKSRGYRPAGKVLYGVECSLLSLVFNMVLNGCGVLSSPSTERYRCGLDDAIRITVRDWTDTDVNDRWVWVKDGRNCHRIHHCLAGGWDGLGQDSQSVPIRTDRKRRLSHDDRCCQIRPALFYEHDGSIRICSNCEGMIRQTAVKMRPSLEFSYCQIRSRLLLAQACFVFPGWLFGTFYSAFQQEGILEVSIRARLRELLSGVRILGRIRTATKMWHFWWPIKVPHFEPAKTPYSLFIFLPEPLMWMAYFRSKHDGRKPQKKHSHIRKVDDYEHCASRAADRDLDDSSAIRSYVSHICYRACVYSRYIRFRRKGRVSSGMSLRCLRNKPTNWVLNVNKGRLAARLQELVMNHVIYDRFDVSFTSVVWSCGRPSSDGFGDHRICKQVVVPRTTKQSIDSPLRRKLVGNIHRDHLVVCVCVEPLGLSRGNFVIAERGNVPPFATCRISGVALLQEE